MFHNNFPDKLMADIGLILEADAKKTGGSCPHCGKLICECGFMQECCTECDKPLDECECGDDVCPKCQSAECKCVKEDEEELTEPSGDKEEIVINPPLETQRF